ncbi:MAG: hypothetical protein AB7D46_05705 [Flavobacteriaceae bacterium]
MKFSAKNPHLRKAAKRYLQVCMKKVTFRGTGQLNGPVIINKTLELEDRIAIDLMGKNKDKVILSLLNVHFPGVKINPRNISINVQSLYKNEEHNDFKKFVKKNKPKSSFSISNIIIWILFFPFKLVWWILKSIWKDDNHIDSKWN